MDICLADIYPEEETRSLVHYTYAPYLFISLGRGALEQLLKLY